jgi:hypothetical protein
MGIASYRGRRRRPGLTQSFFFRSIGELLCLTLHIHLMLCFGKQSSGKSSVLESIVGRDFLPRGSGDLNLNPNFLHGRKTVTDKRKEIGIYLSTLKNSFKRVTCRHCDEAPLSTTASQNRRRQSRLCRILTSSK